MDVGVLMSGTQVGDPTYYASSSQLMDGMLKRKRGGLALDDRGIIRHQYEEKIKKSPFGLWWLRQMHSSGRVNLVHWPRMDQGTKSQLKEEHHDWEDHKYVRTACASNSKKLVTHDKDYSKKVCKILRKRERVTVHSAESACNLI